MITNSMFPTRFEDAWTHLQGDGKHISDYISVVSHFRKHVMNREVLKNDFESDFRAVMMRVRFGMDPKTSERRVSNLARTNLKGWQPRDVSDYGKRLDEELNLRFW